jgi:hypothetical protein
MKIHLIVPKSDGNIVTSSGVPIADPVISSGLGMSHIGTAGTWGFACGGTQPLGSPDGMATDVFKLVTCQECIDVVTRNVPAASIVEPDFTGGFDPCC